MRSTQITYDRDKSQCSTWSNLQRCYCKTVLDEIAPASDFGALMVMPTATEDPVSLGTIVSVEVLDKVVAVLESKGLELPAETVVLVVPLTTLKDGGLTPEGTVIVLNKLFEMEDAELELGVTVTLGP